jgi:XisH protein
MNNAFIIAQYKIITYLCNTMAKDIYHDLVKQALTNDGWTVKDDPYWLHFGKRHVSVDLGAEKWIVAERDTRKIAIEVKSFVGVSIVNDLHKAVGQMNFYHLLMEKQEPERILYLAIPQDTYDELSVEPLLLEFLARHQIRLIVYNTSQPKIEQWID